MQRAPTLLKLADVDLDDLLLCYGDHLGDPVLREAADAGEASDGHNGDGLGDSTATPPGKRGRANAKDGADHEGALPPLVDA